MTDAVFTIRQSWLTEWLTCPERARALWFGEVVDGPTDATAIGTGLHAAIEHTLMGNPIQGALDAGVAALEEELRHEHFRWVQVKTKDTAIAHMATAFQGWVTYALPQLGNPLYIEHHFDLHFHDVVLPDGRTAEVRLEGTIDFIDEWGIWDWKTRKASSTRYKAGWGGEGWQLQRWGIQPTVYCTAADLLGIWADLELDVWRFTFAASSKTSHEVDFLECERGPEHVSWLKKLTANIVTVLSSDLEHYPMNDQHALCSETWCPAWALCKGVTTPAVV